MHILPKNKRKWNFLELSVMRGEGIALNCIWFDCVVFLFQSRCFYSDVLTDFLSFFRDYCLQEEF